MQSNMTYHYQLFQWAMNSRGSNKNSPYCKTPSCTECSQQLKNDGCDKVFTWNFEDQSNCHTIVMVGIGIQTWRCQKGKVVCVQLNVLLKSFLIVHNVLRTHEAHENGRIYIKVYLIRKEDLSHKQGNNCNLNIRCNYLLQDSTHLAHINYRADNCYVTMTSL
jgi:hypothetical protein